MVSGRDVAKWFIFHNPELASGYIDENTKVNKLVYFSNLMHYCVHGGNMICDDFVAFPNGPVVFSVYRDYQYNGLNVMPDRIIMLDSEYEKILDIINLVYGGIVASDLVAESHRHSLWKNVSDLIPSNPIIDFSQIDPELEEYYKNMYHMYCDMDFSKLKRERIGGCAYYYMDGEMEITDEVIGILSSMNHNGEPKFLEMIDGELVVS